MLDYLFAYNTPLASMWYRLSICLVFCFLQIQITFGQDECVKGSTYWIGDIASCSERMSPNPDRGISYWVLYEFSEPMNINTCQGWYEKQHLMKEMPQEALVDYSEDGINWTSFGKFKFPGYEQNQYRGFLGPDFKNQKIKKILFTFPNVIKSDECPYIPELQFNVDAEVQTEHASNIELDFNDLNISIFPNPVKETLRLHFKSKLADKVRIFVIAADGNKEYYKEYQSIIKEQIIPISTMDFGTGLHVVLVETGNVTFTQKVMKI